MLMRPITLVFTSLAAGLVALLPATPAQAQFLKTFVSSTGNDANDCSFTAPCLTFARAHDQTAPGGQIACLNDGDFIGGTITKSITIDCAGTSSLASFGFNVFTAGVVLTLRNLATVGVDFLLGAALFIENCTISDAMTQPAIRFVARTVGTQLAVSKTVFKNNGVIITTSSGTPDPLGGAIQVGPDFGFSAGVMLDRVTFDFNVNALVLDSSLGAIGAVMRNSVVNASRSNGIQVLAGDSPINLTIERSSLVDNIGAAIRSSGANSRVTIRGSTIAGNQTGLSVAGGSIVSYQDNQIRNNGSSDPPTGTATLQ
jgi:hypothetical protein